MESSPGSMPQLSANAEERKSLPGGRGSCKRSLARDQPSSASSRNKHNPAQRYLVRKAGLRDCDWPKVTQQASCKEVGKQTKCSQEVAQVGILHIQCLVYVEIRAIVMKIAHRIRYAAEMAVAFCTVPIPARMDDLSSSLQILNPKSNEMQITAGAEAIELALPLFKNFSEVIHCMNENLDRYIFVTGT